MNLFGGREGREGGGGWVRVGERDGVGRGGREGKGGKGQ